MIDGSRHYLGDESRAMEEQKIERKVYIPWVFRANQVLATWMGMQMGILPYV